MATELPAERAGPFCPILLWLPGVANDLLPLGVRGLAPEPGFDAFGVRGEPPQEGRRSEPAWLQSTGADAMRRVAREDKE